MPMLRTLPWLTSCPALAAPARADDPSLATPDACKSTARTSSSCRARANGDCDIISGLCRGPRLFWVTSNSDWRLMLAASMTETNESRRGGCFGLPWPWELWDVIVMTDAVWGKPRGSVAPFLLAQ